MKNKKNIYLLYAISFLQGLVFYGPVATLYRQASGVSVFQITIIESISLALCIALEMPWGMVADGFDGFLLERLLLSVVMAGMSGCDLSILYLSCREEESQQVFGIYQSLGMAGLLFASIYYSIFIGENYRLAGFLTMAAYGVAAVLALGLKEVKEPEKEKKSMMHFFRTFLDVVKDRYFILGMVGITLLEETNQTITVFLNQLQYVKCGMEPKTMGYVFIMVTLSGIAGGIWSCRLNKKMGILPFSIALFLCGSMSCLVLFQTNSGLLSVLGIVSLRLASSLFGPLKARLQNCRVTSTDRANVLSIYAVIGEACGTGTNLIFGTAAAADLTVARLWGSLLCTVGGILFVISHLKTIHDN